MGYTIVSQPCYNNEEPPRKFMLRDVAWAFSVSCILNSIFPSIPKNKFYDMYCRECSNLLVLVHVHFYLSISLWLHVLRMELKSSSYALDDVDIAGCCRHCSNLLVLDDLYRWEVFRSINWQFGLYYGQCLKSITSESCLLWSELNSFSSVSYVCGQCLNQLFVCHVLCERHSKLWAFNILVDKAVFYFFHELWERVCQRDHIHDVFINSIKENKTSF